MRALHGYNWRAFPAAKAKLPSLPQYLAQVIYRQALRGHLDRKAYGIRAGEVIGRRVKSAAQVREHIGLRQDQVLVLLLFDKDEVLERLYDVSKITELAHAGFDLIAAPSFSIWWPRPRMHHLHNLTRSLEVLGALQDKGGNVIPRIDWVVSQDVVDWVDWLNANSEVQMVSIDSMTSRNNGWDQLMQGLGELDQATGKRLHYLVNGPSSEERWNELFALLGPRRATITDAGPNCWPPSAQEKLQFPGPYRVSYGPRFQQRIAKRVDDVSSTAARFAA